jgi:hypothetical protein
MKRNDFIKILGGNGTEGVIYAGDSQILRINLTPARP